jgi:hypothetical protein
MINNTELGHRLKNTISKISFDDIPAHLSGVLTPFILACTELANTSLTQEEFSEKLKKYRDLINPQMYAVLKDLRSSNSSITLYVTNLLSDIKQIESV